MKTILRKFIVISLFTILLIFSINLSVQAAGVSTVNDLISSDTMKGTLNADTGDDSNSGIVGGINSVIGLMQVAGSGIAIIVVTLLGVKYILASPSDKADVKKSIAPIVTGCILLFGAVNLVAAIVSLSDTAWGNS